MVHKHENAVNNDRTNVIINLGKEVLVESVSETIMNSRCITLSKVAVSIRNRMHDT